MAKATNGRMSGSSYEITADVHSALSALRSPSQNLKMSKRTYFSQPEVAIWARLISGYAVKIPGPPNAMDFLWQRSLESSPENADFSQPDPNRCSSN